MKNKISCTQVDRWIHADLDGRLESEFEPALKNHLNECEMCRHEAQWQKSLRAGFAGASAASARARLRSEFSSQFYARLADQQRKNIPWYVQWWKSLSFFPVRVWKPVLAGGLVLGAVVFLRFPGLWEHRPTPTPVTMTEFGSTGGDAYFSSVVQNTVSDAQRFRADEETRRMLAQNL